MPQLSTPQPMIRLSGVARYRFAPQETMQFTVRDRPHANGPTGGSAQMHFDSEGMPRIQLARKPLGRLRIHRALVLASVVLSLLGPAAAAAKDGPARKLGRGFANLGLGVLAIPGQVIETTRESGPTLGVTWGIIKGTAVMLATEVVGLFEVVTCPFATPPGYRPILEPEFPWQHFSESESQSDVRKVRSATRAGR